MRVIQMMLKSLLLFLVLIEYQLGNVSITDTHDFVAEYFLAE